MHNYMLKAENAIYYECGYSCDNALFLRLGDEAYFITDGRYTLDAKEHVRGAEVIIDRDLYGAAAKRIKKAKVKKIIFDPKEWCVAGFELIRSLTKVRFIPEPDYSHKKRIVKREEEIEKLATAVRLGKKAFNRFARKVQEEGIGKDDVGSGFDIAVHSADRGIQSLGVNCIGARDDSNIGPCSVRSGHFGAHVVDRDQTLIVQMATFLGQDLVLDLQGSSAGCL